MRRALFVAIALVLLSASYALAADADRLYGKLFTEGVGAYNSGDYALALERFSTISNSSSPDGHLCYNLGNTYMRLGDLGRAIMWYERALDLMPGDADLLFNLEYARQLTKDVGYSAQSPIARVVFFARWWLAPNVLIWISICLNVVFWAMLSIMAFRRHAALRTVAAVALALSLVFTPSAVYLLYERHYHPRGVVLEESLPVRSGFLERDATLFTLNPGTMVHIVESRGQHVMIEHSPGKMGWVPEDAIGRI